MLFVFANAGFLIHHTDRRINMDYAVDWLKRFFSFEGVRSR
jgi:hypothetical protein